MMSWRRLNTSWKTCRKNRKPKKRLVKVTFSNWRDAPPYPTQDKMLIRQFVATKTEVKCNWAKRWQKRTCVNFLNGVSCYKIHHRAANFNRRFRNKPTQLKLGGKIRLSMNVTLSSFNFTGGQVTNHIFERKCRTTIQNRGGSSEFSLLLRNKSEFLFLFLLLIFSLLLSELLAH